MKIAYIFASSLLLFACGDDDDDTSDTTPQIDSSTPQIDGDVPQVDAGIDAREPAEFALTSTAVTKGELLDEKYICTEHDGDNLSPPLAWTAGPAGTLSYAIVFRDLNNGLTHSTIFDIPAATLALPEGISEAFEPQEVPGAKQGLSFRGLHRYEGPCPGEVHTYEFTIYALDVATLELEEPAEATRAAVEAAVEAHDLASTTLQLQSE